MSAGRKLLRKLAKSHFERLQKTSKAPAMVEKNTPFRAYWQFLIRKNMERVK